MAITNERSKKKGKRLDNIQSMLVRLNVCLGDSRRTVEDGQNMGGINYTFETKLTADEMSVGPEKDQPPTTYKSITKVGPEKFPGTSRLATICHTCGMTNHKLHE